MKNSIVWILTYLILVLGALLYSVFLILNNFIPPGLTVALLPIICIISGSLGGCTYCLKSIYTTYSVNKNWDPHWNVWYVIRPIISGICGVVAYVFLKLGLFVLESTQNTDPTQFGFIAFSFIAGYNVDKFLTKVEELAEITWGISPSNLHKKNRKSGNAQPHKTDESEQN